MRKRVLKYLKQPTKIFPFVALFLLFLQPLVHCSEADALLRFLGIPFSLDNWSSQNVDPNEADLGTMISFLKQSYFAPYLKNQVLARLEETNGSLTTPNGRWYIFQNMDPQPKWMPLGDIDLPGKTIAVTIHGLLGSLGDMYSLANFLKNQLTVNNHENAKTPYYDVVLGYNYNTYPALQTIGSRFARDLQPIAAKAKSVDIYAHSMGGLVSRWALEKEGLGKHIKRLVMFGTPHQGVPASIFQPIIDLLPSDFQAVRDLLFDIKPEKRISCSKFLEQLNEHNSKYKDNVEYYTLAGAKSTLFYHLGNLVHKGYVKLFGKEVCSDGLVADCSVHADILAHKSTLWAKNTQARKTLPFDHMELVGTAFAFPNPRRHKETQIPKAVTDILQEWAKNWSNP